MPNDLPDYADTLQAFSLGTFNWNAGAPSFNVTGVPAWAQALLFFKADAQSIVFTVTGASGQVVQTPWGVNSLSSLLPNQSLQVIPGLDSSFTVTVTGFPTGSGGGSMTVIASPVLVPSLLPALSVLNNGLDNRLGAGASAYTLTSNIHGPILVESCIITGVTHVANTATVDQLEYGPGSATLAGYLYGSDGASAIKPLNFDFRGANGYGAPLRYAGNATTNGIQVSVQAGFYSQAMMTAYILG